MFFAVNGEMKSISTTLIESLKLFLRQSRAHSYFMVSALERHKKLFTACLIDTARTAVSASTTTPSPVGGFKWVVNY